MAAYYHGGGSEVQAEGMQTLHLMNAGFVRGYPGGQPGLAPASWYVVDSGGGQENGGGGGLIGVNPHLLPESAHLYQPQPQHDAAGVLEFMSRLQYSQWPPVGSPDTAGVIQADELEGRGRESQHHALQRGLSLRLSTPLCQPEAVSVTACEEGRVSPSNSGVSEGFAGVGSILMGSKYLRVAQALLDEVVSMGGGVEEKVRSEKAEKEPTAMTSPDQVQLPRAAELTTSERQELLLKKAKLVSLCDEVEQRYRHYRQQMKMVTTAFEAAAGEGSARPYTALALRTISRQFRCLRDAISGQIRACSRSLGEDVGRPRIKLVDDRLRQQRALQQLGMVQHNAWRPQRGLPEKSVSLLRAWLFENFLHPYPKDSDKIMLAKQTGLTRNQVSNWFINARVRLWKPMVEEMYTEEMKDQEQNHSNDHQQPASEAVTSDTEQHPSPSKSEQANSFQSKNDFTDHQNNTLTIDEELELKTSFKKRRNDATLINSITQPPNTEPTIDGSCGFGSAYQQIGDMGRFDPTQFASSFGNGGFSLTLGLPQLTGAHQPPYISSQNCMMMGRKIQIENDQETDFFAMGAPAIAHDHTSANGYEKLEIQNGKPFGAQLLHDFVV